MMTIIECAKALQEVFNENLEPQDLINALEQREILMQEEIMKEAYNYMNEKDQKTYNITCHHAWEEFAEIMTAVEENCACIKPRVLEEE